MRKYILSLSFYLGLCCGLAALLGSGPAAAATQLEDDEPIDMALQRAPLADTLQAFAEIAGGELDLESGVEGYVTIDLESVPWREALGTICERHRLSCVLLQGSPGQLRVRRTGAGAPPGLVELINMSLRSAAVREVLGAFRFFSGREVIFDEAVGGNVTIHVESAPWAWVLEEICALSDCRVEWGDAAIRILPAPPSAPRSDLELAGVALDEAFRTAAALPVFAPFAAPEVDNPDGLEGWLDVTVEGATWVEVLNALCERAGCTWQLRYGVPSRIVLQATDPRLAREVILDGRTTSLAEAAAELATAIGLKTRLEPGLDATTEVETAGDTLAWRKAMHHLCRQVPCAWRIDGDEVVLRSRVRPLSTHPVSSTEGVDLAIRFVPPRGEGVAGTARFNWAVPISTHFAGDGDPWLVRLAWIPFSSELQIVLPIVGRCDGDRVTGLETLEAVRLPFAEARISSREGMTVELETLTVGARVGDGATRLEGCLPRRPTGKLEASFVHTTAEASASHATATLDNRLGTYLIITPPGGSPEPAAAVVALGRDPQGRQELLLLRPRADGDGVDVDHRALTGGEELTQTIPGRGDDRYELRLRFTENDG